MGALANRVQETTTTAGTGDITLAGATLGCVTFSSRFAVGTIVRYVIDDLAGNWEWGDGTLTGSYTLQRTYPIESSNANALVNFGPGTKNVFVDAVNIDIYEAANFSKLSIMGY